jgi:hypothetical protein
MYFPFPVNLGSIDVRTLRSLDAVLVDAALEVTNEYRKE